MWGAISFGNKTKVPLDYINGLSVGDVKVDCGGRYWTHCGFIFTMNVVNFLELIHPPSKMGSSRQFQMG